MANATPTKTTPQEAPKAPSPKAPDRVIIGESGQAGLPISAPVTAEYDIGLKVKPESIRWKRKGESFVLEQYRVWSSGEGWVEISCSL